MTILLNNVRNDHLIDTPRIFNNSINNVVKPQQIICFAKIYKSTYLIFVHNHNNQIKKNEFIFTWK